VPLVCSTRAGADRLRDRLRFTQRLTPYDSSSKTASTSRALCSTRTTSMPSSPICPTTMLTHGNSVSTRGCQSINDLAQTRIRDLLRPCVEWRRRTNWRGIGVATLCRLPSSVNLSDCSAGTPARGACNSLSRATRRCEPRPRKAFRLWSPDPLRIVAASGSTGVRLPAQRDFATVSTMAVTNWRRSPGRAVRGWFRLSATTRSRSGQATSSTFQKPAWPMQV